MAVFITKSEGLIYSLIDLAIVILVIYLIIWGLNKLVPIHVTTVTETKP